MVKFNVSELSKLAADFEEKAADTLRSGDMPSSRHTKPQRQSEVSVEDAEPVSFDSYLNLATINLVEAKKDLDNALKNMKDFNPLIEMDFYNAHMKIDQAKAYYIKTIDV